MQGGHTTLYSIHLSMMYDCVCVRIYLGIISTSRESLNFGVLEMILQNLFSLYPAIMYETAMGYDEQNCR